MGHTAMNDNSHTYTNATTGLIHRWANLFYRIEIVVI